jgi:hypothetical protein
METSFDSLAPVFASQRPHGAAFALAVSKAKKQSHV